MGINSKLLRDSGDNRTRTSGSAVPSRWPVPRLRRPSGLLEYLDHRLVGMDGIGIEEVIAQQVDDRLDGLADLDHARRQGGARELAAEAPQERGLPIQRQGVHVLRGHHPRESRFGQQPESVAIPEQNPDPVTPPIAEHEQGWREEIEPECLLDEQGEPVDILAPIHRFAVQIEASAQEPLQREAS